MKRLRARHWALSFLLALVVNAAGLVLMVEVNRFIRAPDRRDRSEVKTLHFQEPPKKRRQRPVRRQAVRVRPRAVPLPLPDLPSAVSAAGISLPELGAVDLFGDMLGRDAGLDADLVLKEEAVDEPPQVVLRVAPEYPPAAEDQGIEGYVVFKLKVTSEGRVEQVWVIDARPPGVFEAAAVRAVRQYRFSPARYRGHAVPVLARQKLIFALED